MARCSECGTFIDDPNFDPEHVVIHDTAQDCIRALQRERDDFQHRIEAVTHILKQANHTAVRVPVAQAIGQLVRQCYEALGGGLKERR